MHQQNQKKQFEYTVISTNHQSITQGQWNGIVWGEVPELEIAFFRPESSDHRPVTHVKLLHRPDGLMGIFQVQDQFVRCIHTNFQEAVYKDSCVEFFVQPKPDSGYFNFEFNCGGTLLASYITDPERTGNGFKRYTLLTKKDRKQTDIYHSLPRRIATEIQQEITWYIEFFIPFRLFEKYTGPLIPMEKTRWQANFYKCGDETSHPHWAAWAPVDQLNFHLPHCFGTIYL